MANIKEVAKAAGVSVSTVSRVLNQFPYVSEEVREHVLQVVNQLNYIPNQNAVKLSRGKNGTIGVIVPFSNNTCYDDLIHGILSEAKAMGYQVLLLPTDFDKELESQYYTLLSKKAVDGMIITSKVSEDQMLETLTAYGRVVSTERLTIETVSAVFPNRKKGYENVFQHLVRANRSRIVFTNTREASESNSTREKIAAYEQIIGMATKGCHYFTGINTYQHGYELGQALFSQPLVPDGIFANGDDVAAGIISAAKELGYSYQSDFEIVGEGNLDYSKLLHFSSFDFRLEAVGREAVRHLLSEEPICQKEKTGTFVKRVSMSKGEEASPL